jgi:ADP-ribose pyrophosphatase YjhB (NUDIX family)
MMKGIDYIGVGVGAVILNKRGEIFLAMRGKEARNEQYKWEFPGGSVEFGENLEDAVIFARSRRNMISKSPLSGSSVS